MRMITRQEETVNMKAQLRRAHMAKLFKEKKLALVLDLDNTLLQTVRESNLSEEEGRLFLGVADLAEDHEYPTKIMFRGNGLVTKLRPWVRCFLRDASKMFQLYIYTMGCREYALQMVKYLDPEGVYFRPSRILSREDCTQPSQKGLDVVPVDEKYVMIVDDNKLVWRRHLKNMVRINAYYFFGSSDPLSAICNEPACEGDALYNTLKILTRVHKMFFYPADFYPVDFSNGDVRQLLLKVKDDARQRRPRTNLCGPTNNAVQCH